MPLFMDIIIGVVLLVFGFLGFRDGFVKVCFAIAALLIAIVASTKLMNPVGDLLKTVLIVSGDMAITMGFVLIFISIMLIERFIYGFRMVEESGVFVVSDKVFAIWLGFVMGAAIVSLSLSLLGMFELPSAETQEQSFFYERLVGFAPWIYDHIVGVLPHAKEFSVELANNFQKYRTLSP